MITCRSIDPVLDFPATPDSFSALLLHSTPSMPSIHPSIHLYFHLVLASRQLVGASGQQQVVAERAAAVAGGCGAGEGAAAGRGRKQESGGTRRRCARTGVVEEGWLNVTSAHRNGGRSAWNGGMAWHGGVGVICCCGTPTRHDDTRCLFR